MKSVIWYFGLFFSVKQASSKVLLPPKTKNRPTVSKNARDSYIAVSELRARTEEQKIDLHKGQLELDRQKSEQEMQLRRELQQFEFEKEFKRVELELKFKQSENEVKCRGMEVRKLELELELAKYKSV